MRESEEKKKKRKQRGQASNFLRFVFCVNLHEETNKQKHGCGIISHVFQKYYEWTPKPITAVRVQDNWQALPLGGALTQLNQVERDAVSGT